MRGNEELADEQLRTQLADGGTKVLAKLRWDSRLAEFEPEIHDAIDSV